MCDCLEKINKQLEDFNLIIEEYVVISESNFTTGLPIHTIFLDESKKKRGQKAKPVFAKFCPFCGEKYLDN